MKLIILFVILILKTAYELLFEVNLISFHIYFNKMSILKWYKYKYI